MSKLLVTGGAGFIGSHLTDALVALGHDVVILDNLANGRRENLNPKATFYEADLRDQDALEQIFEREEIAGIFHLAAQASVAVSTKHPDQDADTNVIGLLRLMSVAATHQVKSVLFSSTGGAIYDPTAELPYTETSPTDPLSIYGLSKQAGERYLHYFARVSGMRLTLLRLANVFGPRQDSHGEAGVVSIFTDRMMQRGNPVIDGTGEQTRDFIYVSDVVDAFVTAYGQELSGLYNVATGRETSVNQIYGWLRAATGFDGPEEHGESRPNDMLRSVLSSDKLQQASAWRPRVDLQAGIEKTVAWFRTGE